MDEHQEEDWLINLNNEDSSKIDNRSFTENKLNMAMDYDFRQELEDLGINLEDSLEEAIFSSQENKKPLILYVYSIEDKFFKCVRDIFQNKNVNDLFKYFTIFVWDVFDETTNNNLRQFVKVQNNLNPVHLKAKEGSSSLFVFMTVEHLTLHTTFEGSFKDEEFVNNFYNLHRLQEETLLEKCGKVEMECIGSALSHFEVEFGKDLLLFAKNRLEESLDTVLIADPPYLRRNVVLWFYNKNNKWCKQLTEKIRLDSSVRNVLKSFHIVTWDIGNSSNNETLKRIIKNIFELKYDVSYVRDMYNKMDHKENSMFIFANEGTSEVILKHSASGNINIDDLIVKLIEIQSELEDEYEITNPAELQAIELFFRNNPTLPESSDARPLSETIPEKCLCPSIQERKMLLMLFSNKNDKLHKNLFEAIAKKSEVIQENFVVTPWEVSDSVPYGNLKLAIQRHFDLEKMEQLLDLKKSGIYVFMPIANSLPLFLHMEKDLSASKISRHLDDCVLFFTTEKRIEIKLLDAGVNGDGAVQFQQAIFNQLGNRDYDSFNLDEDQGKYLKEKISYAFYGPPDEDTTVNKEKIKREKKVASVYDKILKQVKKFNAEPKEIIISFIYNCLIPLPKERLRKFEKDPKYVPNLDFTPLPVLVIRKCVKSPSRYPCRVFIDHDERVYTSWNNYLDNNKLPRALFLVPKDGRYQGDVWGNVRLECRLSPMCGIGTTLLTTADIGTAAIGIGAGAVGAASLLAVPIAPIALTIATFAGVGAGIYSLVRSSITIHDRICHDQDMSVFNSQARGAYINIMAGTLGFTGSGAACALTYFASNGAKIGMLTKGAVDGLTGINVLVSGAAVANSTIDVVYQWYDTNEPPDALTVIQLSSSILFFGHAVYNTRSAETMVNEAQAQSLKDIQRSLRSNRHRKTFNKLTKETLRVNADGQQANAEVIAYIKNLNNRDDVLAMLTRNNKGLNKNGVRYMVQDGELSFNGITVSVSDFSNMSNIQRNEYMLNLPPVMETTASQKQRFRDVIRTKFDGVNVIRFGNIFMSLIQNPTMSNLCSNLLNVFSPFIQEKLLLLTRTVLEALNLNTNLQTSFSQLYKEAEIFVRVVEMIRSYLYSRAKESEHDYVTRANEGNDNETFFNRKNVNRIIFFLEVTVIVSTVNMEVAIRDIITYATTWIAEKFVETFENNEPEVETGCFSEKCTECGGYVSSK